MRYGLYFRFALPALLGASAFVAGCTTTPVSVVIDAPANGTVVEAGTTVTLQGRVLGGPFRGISWTIDGNTILNVVAPGSGNTTTTLDTEGLSPGEHTIALSADTFEGPVNASTTIFIVEPGGSVEASAFQAALNADVRQYRFGAGITLTRPDDTLLHVVGGNDISLEGNAGAVEIIVYDDSGAVFEQFTVEGSGMRAAAAGNLSDGGAAILGTNSGNIQLSIYTPGGGVETFQIDSALYHEAFGLNVIEVEGGEPQEQLLVAGSGSGIGSNGEAYLALIDRAANVLQEWRFGGDDYDAFYCAAPASDGGYVSAGVSESPETGDDDMYLVRSDATGGLIFEMRYGNNTDDEETRSVLELADGFLLVGTRFPDAVANPSAILVVRTDANGGVVWEETFGATAPSDEAEAYSALPVDGGALIAGTRLNGSSLDVYLLEIDLDGNVVDEDYYGGSRNDRALSLTAAPDGGYLMTGYSNSFGDPFIEGGYVVKTDEMRASPEPPE